MYLPFHSIYGVLKNKRATTTYVVEVTACLILFPNKICKYDRDIFCDTVILVSITLIIYLNDFIKVL